MSFSVALVVESELVTGATAHFSDSRRYRNVSEQGDTAMSFTMSLSNTDPDPDPPAVPLDLITALSVPVVDTHQRIFLLSFRFVDQEAIGQDSNIGRELLTPQPSLDGHRHRLENYLLRNEAIASLRGRSRLSVVLMQVMLRISLRESRRLL